MAASGRVTAGRRRQGRDKGTVEIDREKENFSNESFPFVVSRLSLVVSHWSLVIGRWGLGGDFFQGFGDGFFDDRIRVFLFVHVVEGEEVRGL